MTKVLFDLSDPLKNTPTIYDGYTLNDLSFWVSAELLETPKLNSPDEYRNKFLVHSVDPTNFGQPVGLPDAPRVIVATRIETHIHKVSHAAGRVMQAFTIFPRERLIVETTSTTTQSSTVATTESVMESASTEATTEISSEVANETGSSNTQQTSWEVGAQGGFGGVGASAKLSGSESATQTAKQLTRSIRKQANKVSRNRKTEFKLHREETISTETVFSKTRTFYNSNYDSPMNVAVHESLGHYMVITQVVGQTLVYQSKARDKEIRVEVTRQQDVTDFINQIAMADMGTPHPALDASIKAALTLDRLQSNGTTSPGYYAPGEQSGYKPKETIKFKSEILEEEYEFRLRGVALDIEEIQLPSGDVIGRVSKGLGDGRGDLSSDLHESVKSLMQERQKLASLGREVVEELKGKISSATSADEAQKWAQLAVEGIEALSSGDDLLESFEEPDQ